jgi:hypothetical protein
MRSGRRAARFRSSRPTQVVAVHGDDVLCERDGAAVSIVLEEIAAAGSEVQFLRRDVAKAGGLLRSSSGRLRTALVEAAWICGLPTTRPPWVATAGSWRTTAATGRRSSAKRGACVRGLAPRPNVYGRGSQGTIMASGVTGGAGQRVHRTHGRGALVREGEGLLQELRRGRRPRVGRPLRALRMALHYVGRHARCPGIEVSRQGSRTASRGIHP